MAEKAQMYRWLNRQAGDRQAGRQTDRQTDGWTGSCLPLGRMDLQGLELLRRICPVLPF